MGKIKTMAASAAVGILAVGGSAIAPAGAQEQTGLVNVFVDDTNIIVNPQVGVNAAVPIGLVANVCGVNVAVLGAIDDSGDEFTCEGDVSQRSMQSLEQAQRFRIDN